jgi:hypothetical protein
VYAFGIADYLLAVTGQHTVLDGIAMIHQSSGIVYSIKLLKEILFHGFITSKISKQER